MADVLNIDELLASEGFTTTGQRSRARAALEEAGLTRAGKSGIAADKLDRVRDLLDERFTRLCRSPECQRLATLRGIRPEDCVPVDSANCDICAGSDNRAATQLMAKKLKAHRVQRLLVVGGTPSLHTEMANLLSDSGLDVRFIDGAAGSHSRAQARKNLQWADVVVVWGATPLPHKVSQLYTDGRTPTDARVIQFARRGIRALCQEVVKSYSR